MLDIKFLKINKCIDQGNKIEANALLNEILLKYPRNLRAKKILDNLNLQLKKSSSKDSFNEKVNTMLQNYKRGQFEKAKNTAIDITKNFSNHTLSWKILASIYANEGHILKSLEANKRALDTNDKDPQCYFNLGNNYREIGEFNKAILNYDKAINLQPEFVEAHYNLGVTYSELHNFRKSEVCFRKTLFINPEFTKAYVNLGGLLSKEGRYIEAKKIFKKALELDPFLPETNFNYGFILNELNDFDEAILFFTRALELKPNCPDTLNGLGFAYQAKQKYEEAEICYQKMISLDSKIPTSITSAGSRYLNKKNFKKALNYFDIYNTDKSRAQALECLYALGNIKEVYHRIEKNSKLDELNLNIAAFCSFITEECKQSPANNFCNNPLDYIYVSNLNSHSENKEILINNVIEELNKIPAKWEDPYRPIKMGFQSQVDIFENPKKSLNNLKNVIDKEIKDYYLRYNTSKCLFMQKWPKNYQIKAWHCIYKEHGYQNSHIHPEGWLSGVIYLKVVPNLGKNEGGIEFNLASPIFERDSMTKYIHNPKKGDMIFFPSSLFHKTIPFTTESDRIIIAFDLVPL